MSFNGIKVTICGKVMQINNTIRSGTRNGSTAFTTLMTGIFATDDNVYRTRPKGGVRLPRVRLNTIITPKCIGFIPKAVTMGMRIGVRIVTDTRVDMKQPIRSRNTLIIISSKKGLAVRVKR